MWNTSLSFSFYTYSEPNYCCCLQLLRVEPADNLLWLHQPFLSLKMCVSCGLLEFKGLVMSRRWVRLSRETWPLIMKFDVLEMLLSKCEFWYRFPRGCTDSEKKFQTNGTKRKISHEYSAWHLLSHAQPHWTINPLLKGLLLYSARPRSLSERSALSLQSHLLCKQFWRDHSYGNYIIAIPNKNTFWE